MTLGNLIETGLAYSKVLGNVGPIGGRCADFIQFLHTQRNVDPSQVHIVGHSLGAHIGTQNCTVFKTQDYHSDNFTILYSRSVWYVLRNSVWKEARKNFWTGPRRSILLSSGGQREATE